MGILRRDQHEQVKEDVGAFRDEMRLVVAEGGDHRFDGLFAQLLGDLGRTRLDQLGGIGLRRIGPLAEFDLGEQGVERVGGRRQRSDPRQANRK